MALETKADWAYAIIGFIIVVAVALGGVWVFNKLTWQPSFHNEGNETVQDEGVSMTFVSGTEYKPGQEGQVIVELRDIYGTPLTGNTSILTTMNTMASGPGYYVTINPYLAERYSCTKFKAKTDFTVTELIVPGDGSYQYPTKCTVFDTEGNMLSNGTTNVSRSYPYGWGCVLSPNVTIAKDLSFYACLDGVDYIYVHRSISASSGNYTSNSIFSYEGGAYGYNFSSLNIDNGNGYDISALRLAYVSPACKATVWYPNKTRYINEEPMRQSDFSGNAFINFTVPSVDGVYEYRAECYAKGKWHLNSKSFHVTQQRIKAVVVK
jgi:hypothetical protein